MQRVSKIVFNHEKARTFLELGGVQIVTVRISIAYFRLFSLTDLHPASCIREHSNVGG